MFKRHGDARHTQRKGPSPDALVVGLGNPGAEYEGTRHNVGFAVVDLVAERFGGTWRASRQRSAVTEVSTPGGRLLLAKPQTFMNVSGESVQALLKHAGLDSDRLLVVHDELDLPLGVLRMKRGGGTAGHQGLNSIVRCTATRDFARLRFGIDRPPGRMPAADFVLRRFRRDEAEEVAVAVERAADMVLHWAEHGVEETQNTYHAS